MRKSEDFGSIRGLTRTAIVQLAPEELPQFDEVWRTYLGNPRTARSILRSGDPVLASGIEIVGATMTPLIAAIIGEAMADLAKPPVAEAAHRLTKRWKWVRPGRAARHKALTGPAPDPLPLERTVMQALFLDIARRAGCTEQSAFQIAETLAAVFTDRPTAESALKQPAPLNQPPRSS